MGAFELEGQVSLQDLVQTRFTPSRSVGPPDPDAPEFTWLRGGGAASAPVSPPEMMAPKVPVPTPNQPTPTPAAGHAEPPSPQAILQMLAASGLGIVLIDDGAATFGGELLALADEERALILDVILDAYDRVLRERAATLREQYLSALKGKGSSLHQTGPTGPPVVPTLHQPQEEANKQGP